MPAPEHPPHGRGQAADPGAGAHQRPAHTDCPRGGAEKLPTLLERVLDAPLYRLQGGRFALGDGPGTQLWAGLRARAIAARTAADAVIGVSEAESAATAAGVLTLGILWL